MWRWLGVSIYPLGLATLEEDFLVCQPASLVVFEVSWWNQVHRISSPLHFDFQYHRLVWDGSDESTAGAAEDMNPHSGGGNLEPDTLYRR